MDRHAQPIRRCQKQIRVWLSVSNLIASDNRQTRADTQCLERGIGTFNSSTGRNSVRNAGLRQVRKQVYRAWKRSDLANKLLVSLGMELLQTLGVGRTDLATRFAQQSIHQ